MENCVIRFARMEDYGCADLLMKQAHDLHVSWRPDIYKPTDVVLPYEEFLDGVGKETLIVAEAYGEVVGLLSFAYRHIGSIKQVSRDIIFIDAMVVDEEFRGRGIGRQLFEFVKVIAQEKKVDGVELQVNARNAQARKMYEKYGFMEKSINMELV